MPATPAAFERTSRIDAPTEQVWARVVSPEGINHELMPIMRMTVPAAARGRGIDDFSPGDHIGRSWLLLGGVLPFDFDDIGLAELEPGRRFLERSTMLSMRTWTHERVVTPVAEGGCEVADRISFRLRRPAAWLPFSHQVVARLLRWVFAHRHRRLSAHFAGR
ncbi:MAG TPA: hypothetical protein VGA69_06065 [Nitriliruptorales bacterium]